MRQATLIYNPLAGPADLDSTISQTAKRWQEMPGWRVAVRATERPGHAIVLARTAAQAGHELVLAAGGDGTLGEVANGLAGSETVLAPLPVGTANSFARELNLPRDGLLGYKIPEVLELLGKGQVQQMDLGFTYLAGPDGRAGQNGRYWMLWTGTGADGYLVHQVEPRPKWSKRMGPITYALRALAAVPTLPEMHARVDVDGHIYEDDYILTVISNCRRYGAEVVLSPHACLDDGLFEVWLFRGKGLTQTIAHLTRVLRGEHLDDADVVCVQGRTLSIHATPIFPCHTDGEPTGYTPLFCEIRPGALRVLVPPTAPPDLFSRPGIPLQA